MSAEIITLPSGRQAFKPRGDNVLTTAGVEIGRAYTRPAPRDLGLYGETWQTVFATSLAGSRVRGANGAMDLRAAWDRETRRVRDRHDDASEANATGLGPLQRPQVIDLCSTPLARLERALRAVGRVLRRWLPR
jgi:hypothetical protein